MGLDSSQERTRSGRIAEAKRLLTRDINYLKTYKLDLSDVKPEDLSDDVFRERTKTMSPEDLVLLGAIWESQREYREQCIATLRATQ